MNWRTDKPTAKLIVADITGSRYPEVLKLGSDCYYGAVNHLPVDYDSIEKWADLEEDETVTDCDDLEEEIKRYNRELWDRDTTLSDIARHFAKWGAEHTFTHHETDESLQEAVTHQMEDEQVIDDYVRRGLDDIVLKYAQLGAKWQREQLRDLCYQCEKNGETIYYNGMKHAVEQMKKEAIERTVKEDAGGYPYIDEIELYDYDKDEPTAKKGDKVKVIILKDE